MKTYGLKTMVLAALTLPGAETLRAQPVRPSRWLFISENPTVPEPAS